MKTRKKISYLSVYICFLSLALFTLPAFYAQGSYISDYGYIHDYDFNYNYNQSNSNEQYYISPLMTSTQPYLYQNNYIGNYYPNNNYWSYFTNNSYTPLNVTCWTNNSYVSPGQPITWSTHVIGGSYGYHIYNWTGTDNPLSLNSSSINVSYQSSGVKFMNVTVSDPNGQSITAYCGSSIVGLYNYYPIYYR